VAQGIKKWLQYQLNGLISVQTVRIDGEAHLDVFTWTGVKINIHLIDTPVKTRAIKRTLQSATDVGTNTLFLVDAGMIPVDGHRFVPAEWLLAVHAVSADRVYAYRLRDNLPELFQAHLEPINGTGEYECWHGPQVIFKRIRSYRHTAKPRFIKGDWLVADFDTPNFWKKQDYRSYRAARDQQKKQGNTTWQTWSGYQTWSDYEDGSNSQHGPIREHLHTCYRMLGISSEASREEVRAAFRKQAISLHPDTSHLPRSEAEARFRELSAAYEYIKTANGW
jgi:hypothetical protein